MVNQATCHLCHLSAIQCSEIIKLIEPTIVTLELDEKRAKNIFEHSSELNQVRLVKDLFKFKTYLDPITLIARIGTRCMNFFCFPGNEFKMSAITAWNLSNQCKVVYGDQDITKTIKSIEKATPFWLIILIIIVNLCIYKCYVSFFKLCLSSTFP